MITSFMAPDAADIGFHTITYVAQDDQDTPLSAAGVVVVQVVPDLATGLSAGTADPLFIAPNPVGDVLHYSMGAHAPAGALQILGTDGRLIRHLGPRSANAGPIDVHDLAPGTYFLRSAGITRRFIKD